MSLLGLLSCRAHGALIRINMVVPFDILQSAAVVISNSYDIFVVISNSCDMIFQFDGIWPTFSHVKNVRGIIIAFFFNRQF